MARPGNSGQPGAYQREAAATAFYDGFGYEVVEGDETTNPAGVVVGPMQMPPD